MFVGFVLGLVGICRILMISAPLFGVYIMAPGFWKIWEFPNLKYGRNSDI